MADRKLISKGKPPAAPAGAPPVPTLDRAQIAARLRAIADDPPPAFLHPGAMCYAPRAALPQAEYLCPTCGARTQYGAKWGTFVTDELPIARRAAATITGVSVRLDESRLCAACSPKATPGLTIELTRAGDTAPRRIEDVSADDLRLLSEFGRDARGHEGHHDFEAPLKDSLPRLEQLLGVARAGSRP